MRPGRSLPLLLAAAVLAGALLAPRDAGASGSVMWRQAPFDRGEVCTGSACATDPGSMPSPGAAAARQGVLAVGAACPGCPAADRASAEFAFSHFALRGSAQATVVFENEGAAGSACIAVLSGAVTLGEECVPGARAVRTLFSMPYGSTVTIRVSLLRVQDHAATASIRTVQVYGDHTPRKPGCAGFDSPVTPVNGMTVTLEIPKTSFQMGEPIPLTLRVKNTGSSLVRTAAPSNHKFDFWIESGDKTVWRWGEYKGHLHAYFYTSFEPGQEHVYSQTWTQKACGDAAGPGLEKPGYWLGNESGALGYVPPVPPGTYTARATFITVDGGWWSNAIPFEIVAPVAA